MNQPYKAINDVMTKECFVPEAVEPMAKLGKRFTLQGYPKTYQLPYLANTRLYKQAGNSIVVPVIQRIAEQIRIAIENEEI